MHAAQRIVLDACVLVPQSLCDLLLRLAEEPRLFCPVWSQEIMVESHRTLTTKLAKKWTRERADRWVEALGQAFPSAMAEPDPEVISKLRNDPKDRHVLAAAIATRAELIVTCNLKDFSAQALKPWGVRAISPDDFLLELYSLHPAAVMHRLHLMAKKGSMTETLSVLSKHVPKFVAAVRDDVGI